MKKFLVIGCGSIGRRHLRNLAALQAGELIGIDLDPKRRQQASQESGCRTESDLGKALAQKPDAALVCTPSSSHVSIAMECARNGLHLFLEKPISHRLDGVDALIHEMDSQGRVGLVGFNLHFHPGLQKTKQFLESNTIGKLLSCRLNAGQYLPDWHPWEDYRKGYSANRSQGGGILFDTHEFEYLAWLAGEPREIFGFSGKVSSLEIDTEDVAEVLFWMGNGALANLHVDYLQRDYQRRYEFYGEDGSLVWDWKQGLSLYRAAMKHWENFPDGVSLDPNETYLAEMKHFLACIEGRETPVVNLRRGKKVLEWTLAALESAQQKKSIALETVAHE